MKTPWKTGRFDTPIELDDDLIDSARGLLGSGYIDDYYASAASEFTWLYKCGYEAALADIKKGDQ